MTVPAEAAAAAAAVIPGLQSRAKVSRDVSSERELVFFYVTRKRQYDTQLSTVIEYTHTHMQTVYPHTVVHHEKTLQEQNTGEESGSHVLESCELK